MTASMTAGTSTATRNDVVIQLDTIDQLFNAPAINPFSEKSIDVTGESALRRVIRQLLSRSVRKTTGARLVIQLPPDQITPGLQTRTAQAVRRYIDARIEDNDLNVRLSRRLGFIELLIASGLAVVVLTLSSLLVGPFANLSEVLRGLIPSFVIILAWVLLWNPLDKLLFEWVEPWEQNAMLHKITSMEIVIEPTNCGSHVPTQEAR